MTRYIAGLAVLLLMGATVQAGELDAEFAGKAFPAPAASQADPVFKVNFADMAPAAEQTQAQGTELDRESPAQSCRWGWRGGWGCGWRGGWGCGWRGSWGCGFRSWGCGYRNYVSWPCYSYAYYPTYVSYSSWGPRWGTYCW